tara:strand:+ start:2899 stop:3741 length:843 start_codon:yes stop_codon:yes gene_type:complete
MKKMSKTYVNTVNDETISNYFNEIRKTSLITPEEEVELAIRIKDGDQKALNKLVESNLKFVISVAKEYQGQGLTLGDLINEGNLGMVKAASRFDHTRGFRFISYAVWWVRQSIKQSLNDNSRTIRLPSNIINKLSSSKKHFERFEFNNEREATYDDFIGNDDVLDISSLPKCSSLNESINEDGSELQQLIEDKSSYTDDMFLDNENMVKEELDIMLGLLSEREREIVECYYGVNKSFEHMTLEDIGGRYGLTKERIRQIKEKALRKLRHNAHNLFDIIND